MRSSSVCRGRRSSIHPESASRIARAACFELTPAFRCCESRSRQRRAKRDQNRSVRTFRAVAPRPSGLNSLVRRRVVLRRLVDLELTALGSPPMAVHHTPSSALTNETSKCLNCRIDTHGGSVQRIHNEIRSTQHLRHWIALPMKRSALNPECVAGGTHVDPTIDQSNGVFAVCLGRSSDRMWP